jgi:hypothetical protein
MIELLCVNGCPNVTPTVERLNKVLAEMSVNSQITQTHVSDHESAQALRFLGSPTVRINGIDIEPSAQSGNDYGLMCRTYPGSGGVPSEEMIRSALAALLPAVGQ